MHLRLLQVGVTFLQFPSAQLTSQRRMGKPLPDSIYNERSASRHGLTLRRGPDPRSFNGASAAVALAGRSMLGLEM